MNCARPSRDETGLELAAVWAKRGTCGRRKVGCVLLDADGYQLSAGYNGPPSGSPHCSASAPCAGFGAPSGTALEACEACHAERNALTRCGDPRAIHTCYVTVSPCESCVKDLLNTHCRRIVFATEYASAHVEVARRRWVDTGREWVHLAPKVDAPTFEATFVGVRADSVVDSHSPTVDTRRRVDRRVTIRRVMTLNDLEDRSMTAPVDTTLTALTAEEYSRFTRERCSFYRVTVSRIGKVLP